MQMDFELPDEIAEFREVTRQIVNGLLVHERAFHETGKVDPIVRKTLVENGYFAMALPRNMAAWGWARWRRRWCRSNWPAFPPVLDRAAPADGAGRQEHHPPWQRGAEGRLLPGMATARSASPLP
jgi:acyl-CoA dehydrogenase